jgi:hypothetical protein
MHHDFPSFYIFANKKVIGDDMKLAEIFVGFQLLMTSLNMDLKMPQFE